MLCVVFSQGKRVKKSIINSTIGIKILIKNVISFSNKRNQDNLPYFKGGSFFFCFYWNFVYCEKAESWDAAYSCRGVFGRLITNTTLFVDVRNTMVKLVQIEATTWFCLFLAYIMAHSNNAILTTVLMPIEGQSWL